MDETYLNDIESGIKNLIEKMKMNKEYLKNMDFIMSLMDKIEEINQNEEINEKLNGNYWCVDLMICDKYEWYNCFNFENPEPKNYYIEKKNNAIIKEEFSEKCACGCCIVCELFYNF